MLRAAWSLLWQSLGNLIELGAVKENEVAVGGRGLNIFLAIEKMDGLVLPVLVRGLPVVVVVLERKVP